MATTTDYINQLKSDKQTLVDNLVAKGVTATSDETFTSLVPKVATISAFEPAGELAITENGTYDVTNYASANVNVPTKTLGTKTITANGTYKATDDNLDGYSEVEVATSGVDINDYFADTISRITTRDYVGSWQKTMKKLRSPLKIDGTDGKFMFYGYPLSEIPTLIGMENVTNMEMMFSYSYSLTDLDLTNWNTSSAKRMKQMFYGCSYLTSLNLSSFNTSNVTNMEQMFGNCSRLTNLNISNFDFTNVTSYSDMFYSVPTDCYILVKDATAKEWITSKFTSLTNVHYVGENYEPSEEETVSLQNILGEEMTDTVYDMTDTEINNTLDEIIGG